MVDEDGELAVVEGAIGWSLPLTVGNEAEL